SMGILGCAAGAAIGSAALPPIVGGAIALGSQAIIGRTIAAILCETDYGKQIPLEIRAITVLAAIPISIFAGAVIATVAGIPVTFSAAVYTIFAGLKMGLAVTAITTTISLAYVAKNGVPAFFDKAIQERIRNTPNEGQRELIRQLLGGLHNLHSPPRRI
ncbi:MAG: hypothetical protein HYZ48_01365, partial [Chlamydiales bacterium]|nr:hypothetical protein [Chlamydiales bacterium]